MNTSQTKHIEVFMRTGGENVMFTVVRDDGHRSSYWLPFWKACWHVLKLIFSGVKVKDAMS